MKTFHSLDALSGNIGAKACVAIGFFDGVHLGHQQVIRQAIDDAHAHEAVPLVVTFDRHPATVVAPDRAPTLIYSRDQCFQVLASLGATNLLVLEFDRAFSLKSAREFITNLFARSGGIQSICVGSNFTFGHRRSGNVAVLKELGDELGFTVHGVAAVSLDGKPVSSTRIRRAIREGDLDLAGQMMGRQYSIVAKVLKGDGLGRKLGFPTANLDVGGLVLPPSGVYAVHVRTGSTEHRGAMNIGARPTISDESGGVRAEVYLLDFEGDLYGQKIETTFVGRIRNEMKFSSTTELSAQISRDVAEARNLF